MRASIYTVCLLLAICISFPAMAQEEGDPFAEDVKTAMNAIPLNTDVELRVRNLDTNMFDYYNLYAFDYVAPKGGVTAAEFLIPKKQDPHKNFYQIYKSELKITTRLCRVTEFINSFAGTEGQPIPMGDYIEIINYKGEKQFFNLDPALPHAVYSICPAKTKEVKK